MQRMAISYVKSYNLVYRQEGHLFQGPFQRIHITDLNYLYHLSRYIHLNPVKADLVLLPENWEYSSYQEYLGLRESGFINTETILGLTNVKPGPDLGKKRAEYRKFVELWNFDYMEFKQQQ